MADSSPPPPSSSTRSAATNKAFKPRANVQRKTKAETDKYLEEEAQRTKARGTAPKTRGAKASRGRGGASVAADKGNDTDSRLRGEVRSGGVFGAGSGQKQKSRQGKASSAGLAQLFDSDGRLIEAPDVEAEVEYGLAELAKAEANAVSVTTSKSAKGKGRAITENIGAQGSADATVPVKSVPKPETVISDDDEPDEERRDIERIWLSSDEEEDEQHDDEAEDDIIDRKGKQKVIQRPKLGGTGGLRPVRAPRTVQPTNTDDEDSARAKKQLSKSKTQDPIDVDEMDIDEVEFLREVPSSPDTRKKALNKKPSGKGKDVKFATETVEERAERLRVSADITKLRQIFSPGEANKHGKRKMSSEPTERLFLLQFPPITPFLVDPNAPVPVAEDEQETTEVSTSTRLKKEPDFPSNSKPIQTHPDTLTSASKSALPSGPIGKLNVHASGKITLDWGGTDMEVKLGTDVGFLQDAVVVDPAGCPEAEGLRKGEQEEEHEVDNVEREKRGTVYALGQVIGKMVVVPDWGRLYD